MLRNRLWHAAGLLKNQKADHVFRKVVELWIAHHGSPEMFVVGQGGEFESAFIVMCEENGIDIGVVGSHAPWQHGGLLGGIFGKVVHQHHAIRRENVKVALATCIQTKNATLIRNGMTSEMAALVVHCNGTTHPIEMTMRCCWLPLVMIEM